MGAAAPRGLEDLHVRPAVSGLHPRPHTVRPRAAEHLRRGPSCVARGRVIARGAGAQRTTQAQTASDGSRRPGRGRGCGAARPWEGPGRGSSLGPREGPYPWGPCLLLTSEPQEARSVLSRPPGSAGGCSSQGALSPPHACPWPLVDTGKQGAPRKETCFAQGSRPEQSILRTFY